VEGQVITAVSLLGVGVFFCWLAFLGWRYRNEDRIGLPHTRFDRWLQRFQIVMMTLFGPIFLFLSVIVLLNELEML
jgi:hypothetical protein